MACSKAVLASPHAIYYPGNGAWTCGLEFLAKALQNCPGFAEGIFTEVIMKWPLESANQDTVEADESRKGFCDMVLMMMSEGHNETANLPDFPDPRGGPLRNWENAANICLEVVRHCPFMRKHWNIRLIKLFHYKIPNVTVKGALREAQNLLAQSVEPGSKKAIKRK